MSNRFWAKTSLVASVIALGVSIIALANRCPTESATGHISFDYMGVILGILALLVTALIGAQVGQYIFVDRKIEDTAGKIARIIAHKSANNMAKKTAEEIADSIARETASNVSKTVSEEIANKAAKEANAIAKETAQKTAKDTVTLITGDLKHILDALSPLVNARVNTAFGRSLRAIGWYCDSLDQCSHIQDSNLRQEYISRLFVEFLHHAEKWKEADRLCADQSLLDTYISLLDKFDNPESAKLKELLRSSREETDKDRVFDHVYFL